MILLFKDCPDLKTFAVGTIGTSITEYKGLDATSEGGWWISREDQEILARWSFRSGAGNRKIYEFLKENYPEVFI